MVDRVQGPIGLIFVGKYRSTLGHFNLNLGQLDRVTMVLFFLFYF